MRKGHSLRGSIYAKYVISWICYVTCK